MRKLLLFITLAWAIVACNQAKKTATGNTLILENKGKPRIKCDDFVTHLPFAYDKPMVFLMVKSIQNTYTK